MIKRLFSKFFKRNERKYHNPIDNKIYESDWKEYTPQGKESPKDGIVVNDGIRLLNTEQEFSDNVNIEELGEYIKEIERHLEKTAQNYEESGIILLQITLSKIGETGFEIAHQGDLGDDFLQDFYDKLTLLKAYNSMLESIKFQINFTINNEK